LAVEDRQRNLQQVITFRIYARGSLTATN